MMDFLLKLIICFMLIVFAKMKKITSVDCGLVECKRISEIYENSNPPLGYLEIATIPSKSFDIFIKQLDPSDNLLVLKSTDDFYIINGEGASSQNASYEYDAVSFQYGHLDLNATENKDSVYEWISAKGPITKPVNLLIFVKGFNPGIQYEYTIPIVSINANDSSNDDNSIKEEWIVDYDHMDSERNETTAEEVVYRLESKSLKSTKYIWKLIVFSPCSKSCGGGIQRPIFRCSRYRSTRFYPMNRCKHLEKPIFHESIYRCNTQACPAYWYADEWKECNCASPKTAYQTRDVRCIQKQSNGVISEVSITQCANLQSAAPEASRLCENCRTEKKTRILRNNHSQKYIHGSITLDPLPTKAVNRSAGIWLASDWYGNDCITCSSPAGKQYRSIFCDRTQSLSNRCDFKLTPDMVRSCRKKTACEKAEWAITDWGECSGDCFDLHRKRHVFCIKNERVVENSECNLNVKPESRSACPLTDVKFCRPRWFYSEWTMCTKSCDGGSQKRSVKCLEFSFDENILVESKDCDHSERQPIQGTCNTQKCPEWSMDSRIDLFENDFSSCKDLIYSCEIVTGSQLCKLAYYRKNCCHSCTEV